MTLPLGPVFGIGIITGIADVIGWLVNAAIDIATAVAAALAAVWTIVGPLLLALWNGLSGVWSTVLKPAWDVIKGWGLKVWDLYQTHVAPILDKIQRITATIRKTYDRLVRPIRDLLGVLQQFLTLTHLAHTAFGSWLSGALRSVDAKIAQVWADLQKPINAVLHILNTVILDARGILQAPLLLESTAAYMGYITQQWWETSLSTIPGVWKDFANSITAPPTIAGGASAGRLLMTRQPGPLDPHMTRALEIFSAYTSDNYSAIDDLHTQDAAAPPAAQP